MIKYTTKIASEQEYRKFLQQYRGKENHEENWNDQLLKRIMPDSVKIPKQFILDKLPAEPTTMDKPAKPVKTTAKLDTSLSSDFADLFTDEMNTAVIGQPEAVEALARAYKTFLVGMHPPNRPIAVLLFAGSTGVGKSNSVMAAAQSLFGNRKALTKIDCAEFQHSHEVAKLIGAPPGYLGFRETSPILSQQSIDKHQTPAVPMNLILLDEIEKAHDAFWSTLLGVFDTGTITLGSGTVTDFSKSIIVMTTNLGARELEKFKTGKFIGFHQPDIDKMSSTVDTAIRGRFTPEFMNRIDSVVVFNDLSRDNLERIFELEMRDIQTRILNAKCPVFILKWTKKAANHIITVGTDTRYGARELKRTIEKLVVNPLSNLIISKQVDNADTVIVDIENGNIVFNHEPR